MTHSLAASVIIPALRAEDVIHRQLTCLAEQTVSDFEVIVADNGSSLALGAVIEGWREDLDIRVVNASARPGCGPARNVGVAAARSNRLLFCDADDYTAPEWVAAFVDALEDTPFATGAKAVVSDGDVDLTNRADVFATARFSTSANTAGVRPYASGGNSAYRRAVLDAVGGFGSHNLRREDVEASWLALGLGFELGFSSDARVLYLGRDRARERWWQSFGYGVGLEALRRQFDPQGRSMPALMTSTKLGISRSVRTPSRAPSALGSIAGQAVERALPGRYFERARRKAASNFD